MFALETLVTQNVGFKLFREIERTKKALTPSVLAKLEFQHEHIDIRERIFRRNFEELIADKIITVENDIKAVLRDAHMKRGDIDVVLRTGGTSLVPAYVHMLECLFGDDKVMDTLTLRWSAAWPL